MSTPVIPPALAARCAEVLNWHRTGVLKGEALRTMSETQPDDLRGDLRIAEAKTALEAMAFVVAYGELVERELAANALGEVA